jgi:sec-independent protein translocase protein TatB
MFDLGADEVLLTTVVAVIAIGPKELPRALRLAGRWIGKIRRFSGAFRAGVESMIREAEINDLESNWAAGRNAVLEDLARKEQEARSAADAPAAASGQPASGQPTTD